MRAAGFLVLSIALGATAEEAKESFDIVRFVVPRGWKRTPSPGLLTFEVSGRRKGQPGSAQVFLFPSERSEVPAARSFQAAWSKLVDEPLGIGGPQHSETEQTPDGWTAITGRADYSHQGGVFRAILINAEPKGTA